jgi:hypothetical protein
VAVRAVALGAAVPVVVAADRVAVRVAADLAAAVVVRAAERVVAVAATRAEESARAAICSRT